jgi:hypothetical protein
MPSLQHLHDFYDYKTVIHEGTRWHDIGHATPCSPQPITHIHTPRIHSNIRELRIHHSAWYRGGYIL